MTMMILLIDGCCELPWSRLNLSIEYFFRVHNYTHQWIKCAQLEQESTGINHRRWMHDNANLLYVNNTTSRTIQGLHLLSPGLLCEHLSAVV